MFSLIFHLKIKILVISTEVKKIFQSFHMLSFLSSNNYILCLARIFLVLFCLILMGTKIYQMKESEYASKKEIGRSLEEIEKGLE